MNYQGISPSQDSSRTYGVFKYISLTALGKLLETYLDQAKINKLHIVIKFNEKIENNFIGYNFDIDGLYLNGSDWTKECPEMCRIMGITLGEKRGKYLYEHFGDKPFVIYNLLPYAMNIGSNDVYYGFTSSPINIKYYDMVNKSIKHRKEVEFLSSKKAPK